MNTNTYVLINATATKYGGALTILKEFLSEVKKRDSTSIYIVFCGVDLTEFASEKLRILKKETNGFGVGGVKRILWDIFGLLLFCKKNRIKPALIISFQNTGVYCPNIKQLIYYHQSIPLYEYKWNFFKKNETTLYFYKNIYPFFIRLFINKNTEFIVQQEFLKKMFLKKFFIQEDRIHVIVPSINLIVDHQIERIILDPLKFHLFYPTNHEVFKNYLMLFEAISEIRMYSPQLFENICLHITLDKNNIDINRKILALKINNQVDLLGNISYTEVISYYNSVNLLVFPSYIETIGLPLIEAAYFGLTILAADLDYAHEVLKDFKGSHFVKFDDAQMWAKSIIELSKMTTREDSICLNSGYNSWIKFLELTENIIKENV